MKCCMEDYPLTQAERAYAYKKNFGTAASMCGGAPLTACPHHVHVTHRPTPLASASWTIDPTQPHPTPSPPTSHIKTPHQEPAGVPPQVSLCPHCIRPDKRLRMKTAEDWLLLLLCSVRDPPAMPSAVNRYTCTEVKLHCTNQHCMETPPRGVFAEHLKVCCWKIIPCI